MRDSCPVLITAIIAASVVWQTQYKLSVAVFFLSQLNPGHSSASFSSKDAHLC